MLTMICGEIFIRFTLKIIEVVQMRGGFTLSAVCGLLIVGSLIFSQGLTQELFTKAWDVVLTYTYYDGIVNDLYVADVNGDRSPEVLLASVFNGASQPGAPNLRGRLVTLDSKGKELWWYETDKGTIFPFYAVAASDVDDDGQTDVELVAYDVEVLNPRSSLWGDPDGTTRLTNAKKQFYETDRQPLSLAVGDVDGDGKNEILFGVQSSDTSGATTWHLYCLYKGGRALKWKTETSGPIGRLVIADVDGDGKNDIVAASGRYLFLFDSDGDKVWSYTSNDSINDFSVYDINGDSMKEIIAIMGRADIVVFNKDGKPTGKKYSAVATPLSIVVDDANNDGAPEIYYTAINSTLVVMDVSGNELFRITDIQGEYVHSLFLADMNRDGKKDIVFAADDWHEHASGKGCGCAERESMPSKGTVPLASRVYVYYNNFPTSVVQQAGNEKIARDYFDLAEGFLASQQYDKAREYYAKARDAYIALGNTEMVSKCDTRLEEIASQQQTPASTEEPKKTGIGAFGIVSILLAAFLNKRDAKRT
jgi:hypothetical protein